MPSLATNPKTSKGPTIRYFIFILSALATFWFWTNSKADASPAAAFGLDAGETAKAMAMTASATPLAAAASNPARLIDTQNIEMAFGIVVSDDQLKLNREDAKLGTYIGWQLELAAALPLGKFRDRLFVGCDLHLPQDGLYDVYNSPIAEPIFITQGASSRRFTLDAGLAVRIWERIAIGASLHIIPAVQADVNIDFRGQNESSSSDVQVDYKFVPKIGIYAEPIQGLHLGFSYHTGMKLDLNVPAQINISDAIGNIHVELLGYAYTEPHTFTLGIQYDFSHLTPYHLAHFALNFDIEYRYYADPIATSAKVLLLDDTGSVMNATDRTYQDFNNAWSLRTALTWNPMNEISVSMGYAFEKSGVPAQRNAFNVLDSDRNRIAFGATFWLPDQWLDTFGLGFSTAAQFDIYVPRNMEKYEFLVDNPGFPAIQMKGFTFAYHAAIMMRFE